MKKIIILTAIICIVTIMSVLIIYLNYTQPEKNGNPTSTSTNATVISSPTGGKKYELGLSEEVGTKDAK